MVWLMVPPRFYKTAHFDFAQNIFECLADTEDCFQRGPAAGGKPATGSRRVYKLENDKLVYDMQLWLKKMQ